MTHVRSRPSKAERAYEAIRALILAGAAPPGEPLAVKTLVQTLALGHIPAREALARLLGEGYVARRRSGGYVVPPVVREEMGDLLHALCAGLARTLQAPTADGPPIAARLAGRLEDALQAAAADRDPGRAFVEAHDAAWRDVAADCLGARPLARLAVDLDLTRPVRVRHAEAPERRQEVAARLAAAGAAAQRGDPAGADAELQALERGLRETLEQMAPPTARVEPYGGLRALLAPKGEGGRSSVPGL